MEKRKFTLQELSKYNGRDGFPAYIAYDELVFDVSASFLWKEGKHQVIHSAGADLTGAIARAPHGIEMLDKFPIVGILTGN
jgi:predicted heme/steroid binding protein